MCSVPHLFGYCLLHSTPRQPQEPPPSGSSSSETFSDELYEWTSEEEARAPDAVQHGPWMPWENLPQDMQPQDGAFKHTSVVEGQPPYYRLVERQDSSSSENMPALVPLSDSEQEMAPPYNRDEAEASQDSASAAVRYIDSHGIQRTEGTLDGTPL